VAVQFELFLRGQSAEREGLHLHRIQLYLRFGLRIGPSRTRRTDLGLNLLLQTTSRYSKRRTECVRAVWRDMGESNVPVYRASSGTESCDGSLR
jgi:hypothetical protein